MPMVGEPFVASRLFHGIFIPDAIYCNENLSSTAKLLYGRLLRYAGRKTFCYPSQATIANEFHVSERQVRNFLTELVDGRYLRSEQVGLGRNNRYYIIWHESFDAKPEDSIDDEEENGISGPDRKFSSGQERQNFSGPERNFSSARTGTVLPVTIKEEESHLRESVKESQESAPAAQDVDASAKGKTQNHDARQEAQTQTQVAPGYPQMGVEPQDADTARAEITGIYRAAKGAKRPKWNTKQGAANLEKLASLLEDLGYATVIAAIHAYVTVFQPDSAFLKDKPLDWILTRERILKFAGETTMPRREAPAAPDASAPPRTAPTTPQVSQELMRSLDTLLKPASEIKAPGFRDPDVLGFWNATMPPQCQAPVMTAGLKQFLVACSSEPEFVKRWRDLVKIAAQVAASGKPKFKLTLSWFLRDGWAKLANHEFDWALPEDAAPASGETSDDPDAEPYGVMDRDAIESAIAAMTRLPFITPERRDDIIDQRNHLRKVWNAQGGEPAYRELAYYIRKNLTRAEQAVWFPKISHMARKRLVEVVEKFKI